MSDVERSAGTDQPSQAIDVAISRGPTLVRPT
jgi:hypothetical protein